MTRHHGLLPARARSAAGARRAGVLSILRWLAAALALALTLATTATGSAFADTSAATPGTLSLATVGTTLAPAAATPCFGTQYPSCASSDPQASFELVSNGDTSGCTFSVVTTWGDGMSTTHNITGSANGNLVDTFKHDYTTPSPFVAPNTYNLTWTSTVTSGTTCQDSSGTLQFIRTCTDNRLSGPAWARQFPTSTSVSDLSGTFQTDVTNFISAMGQAGISVGVIATLRPPQRAYLMHYAWLVANGQLSADQVPAFVPSAGQAPVDICWEHTDTTGAFDSPGSVAAAQGLLRALGVDPNLQVAPALNSLHTRGLAIDMTTTWSAPSITIVNGSGTSVTIATTPQSGLNAQLIAVGATYGVIHFGNPTGDPNHWSVNGH